VSFFFQIKYTVRKNTVSLSIEQLKDKMISLFAFTGLKGTNKNVVAHELKKIKEQQGIRVLTTSFANSLKYLLSQELGIDVKLLYDPLTKESFRFKMQLYGDFIRNTYGETFLVDRVAEEIRVFAKENTEGIVIIEDVRYQRESDFVRSFDRNVLTRVVLMTDGLTRMVGEENIDNIFETSTCDKDEHSSETEQKDIAVNNTFYHCRPNNLRYINTALRLGLRS
jgi:hypothetical protein